MILVDLPDLADVALSRCLKLHTRSVPQGNPHVRGGNATGVAVRYAGDHGLHTS